MKKLFIYNNLTAFRADVNGAPVSKLFKGAYYISSQATDERKNKSCGTASYEDADALLLKGDKKSAQLIKECSAPGKVKSTGAKPRPRTAVVGYLPHIPNYLAGRPDSMITTATIKVKQRITTVIIDGIVPYYMKQREIATASAAVVSAIKAIEDAGQRVNIYLYFGSHAGTEQAAAIIKIKDSGAPLQLNKIAYPLINPSMSRRQFFRFIETRDYLTNNRYTQSYGSCDSQSDAEKILKKNNIKYNKYLKIDTIVEKKTTPEQLVKEITGA